MRSPNGITIAHSYDVPILLAPHCMNVVPSCTKDTQRVFADTAKLHRMVHAVVGFVTREGGLLLESEDDESEMDSLSN